jgi:hypothetical protein
MPHPQTYRDTMAEYQLTHTPTVIRTADNAAIPDDPANRDRQTFDQWVADGGVPDPPAPPSRAGVISQSTQALALSQARQANARGDTQAAVDAILTWIGPKT